MVPDELDKKSIRGTQLGGGGDLDEPIQTPQKVSVPLVIVTVFAEALQQHRCFGFLAGSDGGAQGWGEGGCAGRSTQN